MIIISKIILIIKNNIININKIIINLNNNIEYIIIIINIIISNNNINYIINKYFVNFKLIHIYVMIHKFRYEK